LLTAPARRVRAPANPSKLRVPVRGIAVASPPTVTDADLFLEFWFGTPAEDAATMRAKLRRWFMGGPELDRLIQDRFGYLVEQALAGLLNHWACTPRRRLALILLLDQATRNLYRDTPRAFAGDGHALRLALEALDRGLAAEYSLEERIFLHSPLVHAEDRGLLSRAVALTVRLVQAAPPELRPTYEIGLHQIRKYEAIIYRFGRFPHRNQVLGRKSTPEERAFLLDESNHQPPAGL
jgi:uncharacterized protein (DUF924 family)